MARKYYFFCSLSRVVEPDPVLTVVVSKKTRSHKWRGQTKGRVFICVVISAAGVRHQVAPQWFNLAVRYRRLVQIKPLLAKVAPGYDVHPCVKTGALRLFDLNSEVSYSIPSQWERIERAYLEDPSGRSLSLKERQDAIDEDCLFGDRKEVVIARGWVGGELGELKYAGKEANR